MFNRVLNIPWVLNIPEFWIRLSFWICQGSEYARFTQDSVWNMPDSYICHGSEYIRVLNMPVLLKVLNNCWICLNMYEYIWVCTNILKSGWMAFVLHLPIAVPCLLSRVVTFFNVYMKTGTWGNEISFF